MITEKRNQIRKYRILRIVSPMLKCEPKPRISIILNIRNGAPWLQETLDSILGQTFTDWELIAWDDRSTDESAAIITACQDPRVRYFLSPTGTRLGPARQAAICQARADWLAFIDQDDIWLPAKLEKQVSLIDADVSGRLGIVYGRAVMFWENRRERDFDTWHEFRLLPEGNIFEELFTCSCFILMSSAMLRRSAVAEIGGVPGSADLAPDYWLFTAVARNYLARAVQGAVCRYRIHTESASNSNQRQIHEEALRVIDLWREHVPAHVVAYSRMRHVNLIALEDLQRPRTLVRGLRLILLHGSLPFLLSRPFARLFRMLRRKIRRPLWQEPSPGNTFAPTPSLQSAAPSSPRLSIIIVNWKVRDLLRECLASLYKQMQLSPDLWEVILVDNASNDGTEEMIRAEYPDVHLIANSANFGFGRANNQAFESCHGSYILLLNPDTVVLNHAVDRMILTLDARPDVGALGCRLLNTDGSLQRFTGGGHLGLMNLACYYLLINKILPAWLVPPPLFLKAEPAQPTEAGWVSAACMLLRREALGDRIFDERFFLYGEDLDLCERIAAEGWKVVYSPEMQIIHHGGSSRELQTDRMQLRHLHGLRKVYELKHGVVSLRLFDFVLSVAFLLRCAVFGLGTIFRPGRGLDGRAAASRALFAEAVRCLFGN